MISKYLFLIFTLIIVNVGSRAAAQQFPASIQACIDSGDCTTPVLVSAPSFPPLIGPFLMDQYRYTDRGTEKFLYRYSVGEDSLYEGSFDNGFSPDFTQSVFTGDVWLSANESYAMNSIAHMTLYTDQISRLDGGGLGLQIKMKLRCR
jgi:hypothetical protein